jgi:molybdopterin synthase catalytic subunit
MAIKLCAMEFDPWQEIAMYQQQIPDLKGKYGATSVFVGTMRDFNQGDTVQSLYLEHYPGMTEKQLQHIAHEAEKQWSLLDHLIIHRVGTIAPNDTLVLVATWSAHRGDAFDATRFIMEALKSQAPFWKKETLASGNTRWVEKNSAGYLSKQPKLNTK